MPVADSARQRAVLIAIMLATVTLAMAYALYTQHVWEDYYITFRSSKNLSTGHGLVFNRGDRLHTFTSPLGVLLPALCHLLTLNRSDAGALWLFRLMSCTALGGACVLLVHIAQTKKFSVIAAGAIATWLALDAKVIDFTINGMETGFLLLFLAYALWAHLVPREKAWLHLGAAWAGLMWTRPDSFIYIGLLAAGFWLFNEPGRTGTTRRQMLGLFIRAGLVTTLLYAPWLIGTWLYYGTPIPHTITAKSGIGDPRTLPGALQTLIHLPFSSLRGPTSMEGTFLPSYYLIGGWPEHFVSAARYLAAACSLLWVVPFLRVESRAASLAFFGAHVYLTYYPYFPFPWYLPSTTMLAIFCLGGLIAQGADAATRWQGANPASPRLRLFHGFSLGLVLLMTVGVVWGTWQSARLFSAQQRIVENNHRRKIGEWLRDHAQPGDTVFLESLGYIGYFSNLKTYDFPGMSSREMVEARKTVGASWARLIPHLHPQWLVLRPQEAKRINEDDYAVLSESYEAVKEFSVADQLAALDVYGLPYLRHDAVYTVYRKSTGAPRHDYSKSTSAFPLSNMMLDGAKVVMAHAPSALVFPIPDGATQGTVPFGFMGGAYAPDSAMTDGAIFSVELVSRDVVTVLASRTLDPVATPGDRGLQTFKFAIPPHTAESKLVLRADPGRSMNKDWTCWGEVEFH